MQCMRIAKSILSRIKGPVAMGWKIKREHIMLGGTPHNDSCKKQGVE